MKHSEIFKEAKRLHSLGFAIHWLHPKSKRPIESGWTTGPRKTWDYLKETYMEGLNVGVRLGTPSKIEGKFLAVIDDEIKSKDKKHLDEALHEVGKLLGPDNYRTCPQVRSGRGNGSRHYYCTVGEPFKTWNPAQSKEIIKVHMPSKKPSKKELEALTEKEIKEGLRLSPAWEISLYSDGRQVVLPPSVHPDSGELYHWKRHIHSIDDIPFIELPKEPDIVAEKSATTDLKEITNEKISDFEFTPQVVDVGWLPLSDRIRDGITFGTGVTDRSGFLLQAVSGLISAGLERDEVLSVLTDTDNYIASVAYEHAKTKNRTRAAFWLFKYTFKKVEQERSPDIFKATPMVESRELSPAEIEKQTEELLEEWHWTQGLDRTGKGKVAVSLKNLDLIFANAFDGPLFIKDVFANRIKYGINTPWNRKKDQYLEDIDLVLVKDWLANSSFGIEPNTSLILEATSLIGHREQIHPVRDWLQSLKWDGTPRISTWLKNYCQGEAAEPYLSEVSRKFLLAMVKRVFEPGCQWDYVLVLEGHQGKFKSSIARALAGDKWFMDNLPDLKDKDAMTSLQGKWLIELGELTNVKRGDYSLVKAYLVRRIDTVRAHYGRISEDVPRQSVFIGTVNEGEYLKDPTGNRRFWPVKVGLCDVKGLSAVRDQLFAEAYYIYSEVKEELYLSTDANNQATEAQEDRRVDDDELEMREALIDFMKSEAAQEFNFKRFKARDLFTGVSAPWGRWDGKNYSLNTAAQVLRNLGFLRTKIEGQRIWKMPEDSAKNGAPGHPPQFLNGAAHDYDFM